MNAPVRNQGTGKFVRPFTALERDKRAMEMLTAGASYTQVSDELGYGGVSNLRRSLTRTMQDIYGNDVQIYRQVLSQRYETMIAEAVKTLDAKHVMVSNTGKIVKDDDGNELEDHGPRLAAINTIGRLLDSLAKLVGAQVQRSDVRLTVNEEADLNGRIETLLSQLAAGELSSGD